MACGPNLVMPDQVLRWVWNSEQTDDEPVIPAIDDLILRHYQGVNDALNDEVYEPQMSDPQAWCRSPGRLRFGHDGLGSIDGGAAGVNEMCSCTFRLPRY